MSDKILFGTDEWAKRLCEELNNSKAYAEAAKAWEGDIYFVVEAKGSSLDEDRYVYLDLWHGECRKAVRAEKKDDFKPEFEFRGNVKIFKEVIDNGLDPIKAMLTRKLKLTGNMAKIMRNVKAANELVHCATFVPTDFPLE